MKKDPKDLYQEILLDHSRNPRNFGPLANPHLTTQGRNPKCGDEVTLHLIWSKDESNPVLEKISFEGQGCAISQASASLMTELILGKTKKDITQHLEDFKQMFVKESEPSPTLGDLLALQNINQFPQRIPCAMLAWNALKQALA